MIIIYNYYYFVEYRKFFFTLINFGKFSINLIIYINKNKITIKI